MSDMERLTKRIGIEKMPYLKECGEKGKCDGKCGYCDNLSKAVEKLAYYEDLAEQGRLIELPCPIGTIVYSFDWLIKIDEKSCRDCVYYAVDGSCDYEEEHPACMKVFETKFNANMCDDFGKTVFLAEAEAEAKLKELEG